MLRSFVTYRIVDDICIFLGYAAAKHCYTRAIVVEWFSSEIVGVIWNTTPNMRAGTADTNAKNIPLLFADDSQIDISTLLLKR
jgi:hypothetical protein